MHRENGEYFTLCIEVGPGGCLGVSGSGVSGVRGVRGEGVGRGGS